MRTRTAEILVRLLAAQPGRHNRRWPLTDDLRQRFARYLLAECNLSPATAFGYEQCLLRLERFTGKVAQDISVTDVRTFLRDSPHHPQTKGCTVVAIKPFHKWGVLEELWPANGILGLRGPKLIRNPRPALERDEARTVLSLCKRPNDYRLAYLGLYAGLRISESASITENEWRGDKLRFTGKGRKVREVPVHPELAAKRVIILSHSTTADSLKTSLPRPGLCHRHAVQLSRAQTHLCSAARRGARLARRYWRATRPRRLHHGCRIRARHVAGARRGHRSTLLPIGDDNGTAHLQQRRPQNHDARP
jgi:integrase